MMKYHLFKDSPEEEDRLIKEEIDKYEETISKSAHESTRGLIESHIALTGDPPPTINPPEGESVFGVSQLDPQLSEQAFNALRDTLELTEDDPEARLKAKRSKKRKKRKSKRRKYKHRKSKRKVSKRKKKKTKHR